MPTGTLIRPIPVTATHHYEIHGYGDSLLVQARLAEYGQCSHITWEPGPPAWRLRYDTIMGLSEVERLLQDVVHRCDLRFYEIR
jgi:hypothetical protein